MEIRDAGSKRARNMVWTAAGEYEFDPQYLFFQDDEQPSLYLNTIEGLGYAHFRHDAILDLCKGLEFGRDPERFRIYVQLVLEQAIFNRCKELRPALPTLRKQYAERKLKYMKHYSLYQELGDERQMLIRFYRILGKDTSMFYKKELELADSIEEAATLEEEEMVAKTKALLWNFFMYVFIPPHEEETIEFVGAGAIIVLLSRLMHRSAPVREENGANGADGEETVMRKMNRIWRHLLNKTTADEDLQYVNSVFGECVYDEDDMAKLSAKYCTGYHKKSLLWYVDACRMRGDVGKKQAEQEDKNLAFYHKNQRIYERSIKHITDHLRHAIEEQQEPDIMHSQSGIVDAKSVYRVQKLHDFNIFYHETPNPIPTFSVDLLLDASSSRAEQQENIATQAYIIVKSLQELEIPVQVSTFRSVRDYTVLQRLKHYNDNDASGVFSYFATDSNRDGLAISAMRPYLDLDNSDLGRRLVLILTDADPFDARPVYIPGKRFRYAVDYNDDIAIEDTREAVQQLRQDGVSVAALFLGENYAVKSCRRIFGSNFVRVRSIDGFPEAVVSMLLRILKTFF